jgi:NitT/TauT family transport system ATP-binding protein
MARIRSIDN